MAVELSNHIGDFGRWQKCIIIMIFLTRFCVAWNMLLVVLVGPRAEFQCSDNTTEKCDPNCPEHVFDRSVFDETIIMEFDLVCAKAYLASVVQMGVMFGILIGNVFGGWISDRVGRRPPLVFFCIVQAVAAIMVSFSNWYWLYILLRVVTTICTGANMITTFVYVMEFTALKYRTIIGMLFHFTYFVGYSSLGLIGFFFRNWHTTHLVVGIPQAVFICFWCILFESPRWLITTGKTDKAIIIIERIATINGLPTADIGANVEKKAKEDAQAAEASGSKSTGGSCVDLFRTKRMRTKFICLMVNWFVISMAYYGIAQYVSMIGGNIFINLTSAGALQLPSSFLCIGLMDRIGRRCSLFVAYLIGIIPMYVILIVPKDINWPIALCASIASLGVAMCYCMIYQYSAELFPTVVRNLGMGICSMMGRVGAMISPFFLLLNDFSAFLPPFLFAMLPTIGVICTLPLLPDTSNLPLPDTVEDADKI